MLLYRRATEGLKCISNTGFLFAVEGESTLCLGSQGRDQMACHPTAAEGAGRQVVRRFQGSSSRGMACNVYAKHLKIQIWPSQYNFTITLKNKYKDQIKRLITLSHRENVYT